MSSEKDIQELVVSVSGKTVSVDPCFSQLMNNLPPEAAAMLAMMQGHTAPSPASTNTDEKAMGILDSTLNSISNGQKKISDTNPDLRSIVEQEMHQHSTEIEQIIESKKSRADDFTKSMINRLTPEIAEMMKAARRANNPDDTSKNQPAETIKAVEPPKPVEQQQQPVAPSQEMVRTRSVELQLAFDRQQALEQIKSAPNNRAKLTIHECGVALGIVVGSTSKAEVTTIMNNFSKVVCPADDNDLMFFYSDIHVSIFYSDDLIVRELQFGEYYRGETSKGLNLGDPLEKAFELYGQPRMKSPRGAIWNKFGVFCQNNHISSIRIQA